ncbi:putative phage tail assembly chaperone (plasmid) [Halodesulfovibrio aestuarii]|uniref:Phage tail assembly chaperone n=1 Tax=Halodesulfovibrio aestuarii TaxID=126333 RepID=A0A8G2FCC9_9BACT|nr:putative phage tail assembly chaperone [Halodesulfovibrio aestuarii]SHJ72208.1 Phage tail assembly chaperone [Halodesulfovibrio aestuarii]
MEQKLKLTIAGKDFTFNLTTEDYNDFINALDGNNKIEAAHNFLVRVIDKAQKDDLLKILDSPGAPVQIMTIITREFVPDLNIQVGK